MFIKPSGQRKNKGFVSGAGRPTSSQSYNPRVPHWWGEENMGLKSVVICPRCQAIYYDKHWHSWQTAGRRLPSGLKTKEAMCLACAALTTGKGSSTSGYAGEVILSGLSNLGRRLEIINLIKNVGKRAVRRNPEDQIIKIEDKTDTVRVTTTENQLAIAIGKEVDAAEKGGKLTIAWSAENKPARVRWVAPPLKK